jgi:hypothetical protein
MKRDPQADLKVCNKIPPLTKDVRIGCLALYAGEKRNCLSDIEKSPDCYFYAHGYRGENSWMVHGRHIDIANFIETAQQALPYYIDKTLQLESMVKHLERVLRDNTYRYNHSDEYISF